MRTVLAIVALIGLLIFVVGAVIWFVGRPRTATVMVIGGLVYVVAQVFLLVDALL